ncbi:CHAT domain protein [Arthrobacter ulcerisalmonis]|uniref:CHAT domain protein n=1 Tax=Arthrobacter ulcerisalmonis TaxID=2483813 RepID=A0A3P5WLI8_9MICC|nr:CHAT domain-containing protein [Arthrobacter ulcerisalmonis]VDC22548.1 CHAT domain protein [Arthrobacter ulcerisalmonis]
MSEPILYVVAFSSEDASDAAYSPITTDWEQSGEGGTRPQLLSREIVPALPALWYCLHLPKSPHDIVDIRIKYLPWLQEAAFAHNILLVPMGLVRRAVTGIPKEWSRTLLIGPDDEQAELARLGRDLGFSLSPAVFSELSTISLRTHWKTIAENQSASVSAGLRKTGIEPVTALETGGIELPMRRLLRQVGNKNVELPTDPESMVLEAWRIQAFVAALAQLDSENVPMAEDRLPSEWEAAAQRLRRPLTIGLPGVSPKQRRLYQLKHEDTPVAAPVRPSILVWPERYQDASDSDIESSVIALLVAHQAIADDSLGITMPAVPPKAFTALAALEQHCADLAKRGQTARPLAVRKLLKQLNKAIQPVWEDPLANNLMRASALTIIGSFPIGLSTPPGSSDPLSCLMPVSYRPLVPLTRSVPNALLPRRNAQLGQGFKVLVAECIVAEDPVGQASRRAWGAVSEMFSRDDPRSSMTYQMTLSVDDLRDAIAEHQPDVLVISAHGFYNPAQNVAGIQVGKGFSFGVDLGPLPPLVILSACHVAPRGTGAVTITDLLLREGAIAVLGTLVPVNVVHNAVLMQRFFVYMIEVLAGRADHKSVREVWHRVQTSNAVHDVTSGHPMFEEWFMTRPPAGGPSPHELFKLGGSTKRLRRGNVYGDTEARLLEIADGFGDKDRVTNWLKHDYVPESAFYCFIGDPDRIHLQPPTDPSSI